MDEGSFIKMEFIGKVKNTGEIFDLTDAELAKKEGIFNEKQKYEPQLVIIGAQSVVPGVENELKKMKIGEEKEFDVAVDKAFGKRDFKLVKILSLTKFYQQKVNPVPGAFVNIDNKMCKIQSVSGGRVRVDFNHPLAGKDLHYKVKIVSQVTDVKEKLDGLLEMYGLPAETKLEKNKAVVKLDNKNPYVEAVVQGAVKKWIKGIEKVEFEYKESKDKKIEK